MRVLWLCNIILPVIAKQLGLPVSNKEGWLAGLSERLLAEQGENQIELGVCFPVAPGTQEVRGRAEGIRYYGFAEDTMHPERYDKALEERLGKILEEFCPDVVHCFGTEYPHTLALTRAWRRPGRTLIGIQGLCFVYADAYMADLPVRIQRRTLLRDFLRQDNLRQQQKKYRKRGVYEQEALRNTAHVTGRTDWDKKWTAAVNPRASYHFMNETLRSPFYQARWKKEHCKPYQIFVSQGNYPIKGLHYLLQAMPALIQRYPALSVCVAGDEITRFSTLREKIKLSNYGAYLRELIRNNHLEGAVTFLGKLSAEQMLEQFLKSHVFLSPSSIENSPNSVGEAMLLGMPVASSDVGGVHNMLCSGREGLLYPAGDVGALTGALTLLLDPKRETETAAMGEAARAHALRTHDPEANYRRLMEIYHEINLCV